MKKNLSGLFVVTATLVLAMGTTSVQAQDATGMPSFSPMSPENATDLVPGIGPGNKTEEAINKTTKATAKNTETAVLQNNQHIDSTRMGNLGQIVVMGSAADLARALDKRADRLARLVDRSNDISLDIKKRRAASTAGQGEEGIPDTASAAVDENSQNRNVTRATFSETAINHMTDPENGTNTNIFMNRLRQKRGPAGMQKVGDLFRNGCHALGLCNHFAKVIQEQRGKLLADVGPATQKNIATLIASPGGGDDTEGAALDTCKINGRNNELSGNDPGIQAGVIAIDLAVGAAMLDHPEVFQDMYQTGSKADSLNGMDEDLKRMFARKLAANVSNETVNDFIDSTSRKGGCDSQQAFDKGVKETGKKGSEGGKCYSNNMLRDQAVPAAQKLAAKADRSNPGGSNQNVKSNQSLGRLSSTAGSVLSGNTGGKCSGGVSPTKVAALLTNKEFLAMINSKEFLVAYIDAPKYGEGSIYDGINVIIANAWEKYEGTGAFMYTNLMLNQPKMYASNAQKYASLFQFKPFPYEKGIMIAMKEHEKTDPNYNFYTQRIEKAPKTQIANLDAPMPAPEAPVALATATPSVTNAQLVSTKELPELDLSNVSLKDLFMKVGVHFNNEGIVTIPTPELVPPSVGPKKVEELRVDATSPAIDVPVMKATLVSTAAIAQ